MLVVEPAVAKQGLFEIFATPEMMGFQDVRDAPIEALDPSIGLRRPGSGQAMFDVQRGAQSVEFMLAAGLFVAIKEPAGEFLAVVRQALPEADRTDADEVLQESPGAPGGLVFLDLENKPSGPPGRWRRRDSVASSRLSSAAKTSRPGKESPAHHP
jgi:hypothetical protein